MNRTQSTTLTLALAGLLGVPACADDDSDPMAEGGTTTAEEATTDEQDDDAVASAGETDPTEDDDTSGGDDPTGQTDPTGEDDTTGAGADELYDCEDPNIIIVPMVGPGFDPETGDYVGPPQDSFVAHTTLAVVTDEGMEEFMTVNDMVVAQLMQTPGVLGVGFAIEPECGFLRTIGLWEDEGSLYTFVASGAHLEAMQQAPDLSIGGKTTHWEIDAGAMPLTWDMALGYLDDVEPSPLYE